MVYRAKSCNRVNLHGNTQTQKSERFSYKFLIHRGKCCYKCVADRKLLHRTVYMKYPLSLLRKLFINNFCIL